MSEEGKEKTASSLVKKFYRFDIYLTMIAVLIILAGLNVLQFGISNTIPQLVLAVVSSVFVEALWDFYKLRKWQYSKSAIITGLFIGSLLDPGQILYVPVVAGIVAILSKQLIRAKGRAFFNPTIFSMLVVSVVFKTSLGWWSSVNIIATAMLGLFISVKYKRLGLTIPFLALSALIVYAQTMSLTSAENLLMSAPFLFFTFFMLVEPKTSPFSGRGRMIYAVISSLLYFAVGFVLARMTGYLGFALDTTVVTLLLANVIAWIMNWKLV